MKNKAPAPLQISAEQLLREAVDRHEPTLAAPTTRFADLEELHEHQARARKEFEDHIRRNRINIGNWLRYAQWELEQKEYRRARSVFERALDVEGTNVQLWTRYVEAEMRERNIQHARNLLDRATTLLPRVEKLWYKYVYMEEMLGNISGTRAVFERWMSWEPDEQAWNSYIKLEKRYAEFDRARNIFERFTIVHPEPRNWIKWARFEEENGTTDLVREVFGTAIETLGEEFLDEKVIIAYARFEAKLKEFERARAIYKYALDRLPRSKSAILHKQYTTFEKQHGDLSGVEDVVLAKRRVMYEDLVTREPRNYDAWFDYARLEEASALSSTTDPDHTRVREIYERAVSHPPPGKEKRHWRRYLYLWIFYALYEETVAHSPSRAAQVYSTALSLLPHKTFTSAKLWTLLAQLQVREGNLAGARKTMGTALGLAPKPKLYKNYIALELSLFEFSRVRTLYSAYITHFPSDCGAWIKFTELERGLGDTDRARAIFELATEQAELDLPERLWKAFIEFEEDEATGMEGYERARGLYERLLSRTEHVKVWVAYAQFEVGVPDFSSEEGEEEEEEEEAPIAPASIVRARGVFERAHELYKSRSLSEERVALLQAWKSFEDVHGGEEEREKIAKQMPRRVKKRRRLEDGSYEEFMDYAFPADEVGGGKMGKLAEMARKWKEEQERAAAAAGDGVEEEGGMEG